MKNILKSSLIALSILSLVWGCAKDSVAPTLEGVAIVDYDLIQVTNDSPVLPVTIKANDNTQLSKVAVVVTTDADAKIVATQEIRNITASALRGVSVNVAFPLPATAPSGLYKIEYTVTDAEGNKSTKSYKVNILNYRTVTVDKCVFPTVGLPAGKNVTLFVTAPANTEGNLYVSGNFEQAAGGKGDWTGGGTEALKLTKVSTTCYYIHLNLTASSEFKITRGEWGKNMKGANGEELDNLKWDNKPAMNYTIPNWSDRLTSPPITLPVVAISSNKLTVVADVKNNDAAKYYLVKKGATSLTGAIEMSRVKNSTLLAGAAPREAGVEYVVVRDAIANVGINAYGYEQVGSFDGTTNPVYIVVDTYKPNPPVLAPTQKLFIVGDATAGGWNNPVPANQEFKRIAEGKFELTLPLQAKEYLLLPTNGSWDFKWGMSGANSLAGNLNFQGSNFKAPVAGTYKIEVDFFKGIYKLTRQ
jgi:hypothetical protein